jgi:hypothetical protein
MSSAPPWGLEWRGGQPTIGAGALRAWSAVGVRATLGQLILRKVPSFKIEMGVFLKINFSIGPRCAGGRGASREIGVVSGSRQYCVEHGLSELASERVLLTRVVAPDQQ